MGGEIITVEGSRFPPPQFEDQPDDAIALPGSTVELKCNTLYQHTKLNFGWILNGSELVLSNVVPRKTFVYNLSLSNGNLRIDNISGEAYGVYQCVARYSAGTIISRKAHVRMPYLYKTNDQPATDIICNETYPCVLKPPSLVSFPEPSFAWEFRRSSNETFSDIENSHGGSAMFVVSREGHLCILGVTQSDQGQYRCGISNIAGTVYEVYNVTIGRTNMSTEQNNTRHGLSILVKPKNITVGVSSSASFDCIASERNTEIRWSKGNEWIDSSKKYDISLPYRLIVKQTSVDDEGWYTCEVSNNFSTVSQKSFLNVREVVKLIANWPDRQEIVKGGVLILKAIAYYGKIQWYWNGQPIDRHFQNGSSPNVRNITRKVTKIGHEIVSDEQTLRVEGMALYNSGIYQVLATGFNGQDLKHTEVTSYRPTTFPTTKVTEPTSFPSEREANGRTTQFTTKISRVERTTNAVKRSTENEGSVEESRSKSNSAIVYGVVVFICLTILVIALLLVIKRKGNFILTCIKGNNNDNRKEDTERQGHELNEGPSGCEIILYDTPGEGYCGQSTNETEDGPIYDVLEGPGEEQGSENPDQSTNIYASVNEVCVSEEEARTSSPLGNFEVSFLEEIYTTLTADRDSEDVNIYESLRRGNAGNERCDGWSVEGMQSSDQDYVSIVN